MKGFRKWNLKDEKGKEIIAVRHMVRYLDGWVLILEDGSLYTDVEEQLLTNNK